MSILDLINSYSEKSRGRKEEYDRFKELTESYSDQKKEILNQINYDNTPEIMDSVKDQTLNWFNKSKSELLERNKIRSKFKSVQDEISGETDPAKVKAILLRIEKFYEKYSWLVDDPEIEEMSSELKAVEEVFKDRNKHFKNLGYNHLVVKLT